MGLFYEFMRLSLKNIELLGGYSGRTHLFKDIQKAFSLSLALSLYVRSSVRGTFGKLLCENTPLRRHTEKWGERGYFLLLPTAPIQIPHYHPVPL